MLADVSEPLRGSETLENCMPELSIKLTRQISDFDLSVSFLATLPAILPAC